MDFSFSNSHFFIQGVAEEIRILDWPYIRYVSPALDLLFLIFSSTNKSLRDKEYGNLLKIYHSSLSNVVERLGSQPDKHFSFQDLEDQMKLCGNYALLLAPGMIDISLRDGTDADKVQAEFDQRINDLVTDVVELGYYRKNSFGARAADEFRLDQP